ncbi:class I SAM-dependent methyltransferase [Thalassomonas actiniarum]|uniref:Methyltransferase domain-containing protein n=1 Tax=Thalassomonas actiniarum TaxID=485447 RepID=A0AAE9YTU6_9GAMM|nr:class I SAM-dependent methyltransferase [Thalassomonas actiniarum]WDE01120.1 methyltransferase domain-containing protein [Thalassomonas actiniarum]
MPDTNHNAASLSDQHIIDSWLKNAKPWTAAIDNQEITSRVEVTNAAVIEVLLKLCSQKRPENRPLKLLDLGCGEGWLMRALDKGRKEAGDAVVIDMLGIDIVPELIANGEKQGVGRFKALSYEALSFENLQEKFDVIVCNFSLLGEQSVNRVFAQLAHLLKGDGAFVVQTLHPVSACGDQPYRDGWRSGSWQGFSEDFVDPPPWYFRTLPSWLALFTDNGLTSPEIIEPKRCNNSAPLSVIFVAEKA